MNKDATLFLLPIGMDEWSRMLYKGSNGRMYVDVDGEPHTMTSEGEPDSPTGHSWDVLTQEEWNQYVGHK